MSSFLIQTARVISTPPSLTACVVVKLSVPLNCSPKPRISSPLKRGAPGTCTLMPPKPLIVVL